MYIVHDHYAHKYAMTLTLHKSGLSPFRVHKFQFPNRNITIDDQLPHDLI
jgi:hypothetical protein